MSVLVAAEHRGAPVRALLARLLSALVVATAAADASAVTIGYWRMEQDDDATANGLSVPNEVAGGSALVSSEAFLDTANLPGVSVPATGASNTSSVGATMQGGGNGINGSAAWYSALDVTSISVEFWARTVESFATPFQFGSGSGDGILIDDPNDLDVTWHVDVPGVGVQAFSLNDLDDMDAGWSHYAFTYDEVTGVAAFYVDGVLVDSNDGPDNSPLVILPGSAVEIGVIMDFAAANRGTMDEVRLDGSSLAPSEFLVPEPGPGWLVAAGLIAGFALPRRR